jgi:hypothetical protein
MPHTTVTSKKKKLKKAVQDKNKQRRVANIVRVDRIVADALDSGSVDAVDFSAGVPVAEETRGQLLQRHKAEKVALRTQVRYLREQRIKLGKSLEALEEKKQISSQIRQLEERLREAHQTQLAALEAREGTAVPDTIIAPQFAQTTGKGPLRVMSTVHTPGPQYARNMAAASSSSQS